MLAHEDGLYSEAFTGFEGPLSSHMQDGVYIVWDRGSCWVGGAKNKNSSLNAFQDAYNKGRVELSFEGDKLKGKFVISRRSANTTAWSISKENDRFSSGSLFRFNDESVLSQRTLDDWLSSHSMAVGRSWADLALPKSFFGKSGIP